MLIARSKAVAEAKKKAKKKNAKGVLSPRTAADKAEKAVPMPALAFGIKGNETKEQQLAWAKPGGATVGASAKYAMPTGAMVAVGAGTHEEEEEEEDVRPSCDCVCASDLSTPWSCFHRLSLSWPCPTRLHAHAQEKSKQPEKCSLLKQASMALVGLAFAGAFAVVSTLFNVSILHASVSTVMPVRRRRQLRFLPCCLLGWRLRGCCPAWLVYSAWSASTESPAIGGVLVQTLSIKEMMQSVEDALSVLQIPFIGPVFSGLRQVGHSVSTLPDDPGSLLRWSFGV